ncbi:MAG: TolC family protein [Treponema sp.]|jgi:outer membrane protein TolC|nr:TolC family protein [Treponema sp.]
MRRRILPFFLLLFLALRLNAENADLSLDFAGAGQMAVSASEELRNQYRRHALREGAWTWGLRAYFPQLSVSISEDDRLSKVSPDSFLKSYSFNLTQLAWDGGRISMSRKMEKESLNLEGSVLERSGDEIAESAVSQYRQILLLRKLIEIRKRTLESMEEQRRILSREVELGLALSLDLAGADIKVAESKLEILSLGLNLDEAEQQFADTLGVAKLPELSEDIDYTRQFKPINTSIARSVAESGNQDLAAAKFAINRSRIEAKMASNSWIPTIKLNGGFSLSGQHYPLNKHNWSLGLSIEFSSPWVSGSIGGSAGWEPPYDRTARLQNTFSPAPDPSGMFSARNAQLALELERSNYKLLFKQLGRRAEQGVEKCVILEKKRALAVEILDLEESKYHLAELNLELGKLTRNELMEARLEYAAKEAAAVEVAVSLLEAERELERLLNIGPGELSALAERNVFSVYP